MNADLRRKTGAVVAAAFAAGVLATSAAQAQTAAPRYVPDLTWPRPLPDRWVLGGLGGVCIDANDHVFILNRQDVIEGDLNAGKLAPPIIEFDPDGNVVNSWGDLTVLDPRLHSCHFDRDGNFWVASAPSAMVQKYSHDGRSLLQTIGKKGDYDSSDGTEKGKPLNSPGAKFLMPSSIYVDRQNGDVYVADGEAVKSNRRIAVMDKDGRFLRHWLPENMSEVHCMTIANDQDVYVCNRRGSRIHVYDKLGNLKRVIEVPWQPYTPPPDGKRVETGGSAVAIDFSPDPQQRLIFVVNQNNSQVEIIERTTGKHLGSFGRPGAFPGEFVQAHGIAVDSKGNVYVAENRGRRIHKFKPVSP